MWKGRFSQSTEALLLEFTESLQVDKLFYLEDIECSKAHAKMLGNQGIISREEADLIQKGLEDIRLEIEQGDFQWKTELEDIHMNIENRLVELIGSVGQKLHTGRSRNDQIALDFRLYTCRRLNAWEDLLLQLMHVLVTQAEEHKKTVMPGYTHFQAAQPVSLAHHLLAYVQMFKRDVQRIRETQKRVRVSPLGAAALAGTTYPLDTQFVAREIGFEGVFANSMDAVSDRDYLLEALFAASMIMTHLSRLCEEMIIWANPCFGFIELPDNLSTGSSIMPQKKNPDVFELMRGKASSVYGTLISLFSLLKSLPLSYNRDLQEDKPGFVQTDRNVHLSLRIMQAMLASLEFKPQNMLKAISSGYLNATELADYLVNKGMPFRQSHYIAGQAVAYAENKGLGLEDLSLKEFQKFSPLVSEDVYTVLAYENAVARRISQGGTGFDSVNRQIQDIKQWLAKNMAGGSV